MLYKAIPFAGNIKDMSLSKRSALIAFATYKTLDRDQDRANKGMFTKSWNESFSDIRLFLNHKKEQAPGKPIRFEEDDDHAYSEVKLGTHTLGEDTLKMMDEGIITDNSYGFDLIKSLPIKDKGKDMKEAKLWEISLLTHWGAHQDSKVLEVNKSRRGHHEEKEYFGNFSVTDEVCVRPGYEHIASHAGQDMIVVEKTGWDYSAFYAIRLPDGTSYRWYRGDELVPCDDTEPDNDPDEMDDEQMMAAMSELNAKIKTMQSFCRNTTASDDAIKNVLSELESAQNLLKSFDTAATSKRRKPAASVDKEFADALTLLTLKF